MFASRKSGCKHFRKSKNLPIKFKAISIKINELFIKKRKIKWSVKWAV